MIYLHDYFFIYHFHGNQHTESKVTQKWAIDFFLCVWESVRLFMNCQRHQQNVNENNGGC